MTDIVDTAMEVRSAGLAAQGATHPGKTLSVATKTIYGSGALVETVINTVLTAYQFLYLTAICGLSGSLAGIAMSLALAVDAFADPFVGSISDRTRSRLGRRHPYMLVAALPITISFGLLFSLPPSFKGMTLFVYSTAILFCMRLAISTFVIPYMAMGGELTDDFHERSVVVAYRHAFGILAGFLPIVIGLPLFLKGANIYSRGAYVPYVWTCAGIVLAGAAISTLGSLKDRHRLYQPAEHATTGWNFFGEVAEVFRNSSFRILFFSLVIFFVAQGMAGVLALSAGLLFWKLATGTIFLLQISVPFGSIVGIPIILTLAQQFEKRTIVLWGMFGFCFCQMAPALMRIAGLLPTGGLMLTGFLVVVYFFVGIIVTALVIGFQSMMADAADEHDYLFSARREGVYFAGLSFSVKLTAAAGGLMAGFANDIIGIPPGFAQHGAAGVHIANATLLKLGLIAGPVPALITFACIAITWQYKIDRKRHAVIRAALAERGRN